MADVTKLLQMNVTALKRVDPYVKAILETATHVALYTFNAEDNEWEKTNVKGALFVYSRNREPYHSMLMMNRLNTNNLVEHITQGFDLQLQEPFLMCRNSNCRIFGLWFYNKDECIRIEAVLHKLVKEFEMNKKMQDKSAVKNKQTSSEQSVDTFTRAQEDHNSNKCQVNDIQMPGEECKAEMPQGVADFFAKVSSGASHFGADKVAQVGGLFSHQQGKADVKLVDDSAENKLKPLLQQFMSNPAHSVEQIEKQQRSVTSQSETAALKRNKGQSQTNKDEKKHNNGVNLLSLSEMSLSSGNTSDTIIFQSSTKGQSLPTYTSTTVVKSSMVKEVGTPDQQPFSAPLCGGMEAPQKPTLMPPAMFMSSAAKDAALCKACLTLRAKPEGSSTSVTLGASSSHLKDDGLIPDNPGPLTKDQLLQAFSNLMKNDPEFINRLHESYAKSLAKKYVKQGDA